MAFEKVVGSRNNMQFRRSLRWQVSHSFFQSINVTKLVAFTMHKQYRLAALAEKTKVVLVHRRADTNKIAYSLVCDAYLDADSCAKRKATQRDGLIGVVFTQVIQTCLNV